MLIGLADLFPFIHLHVLASTELLTLPLDKDIEIPAESFSHHLRDYSDLVSEQDSFISAKKQFSVEEELFNPPLGTIAPGYQKNIHTHRPSITILTSTPP